MMQKNQYAITYQSKHRLWFLTAFCYVEKWSYQSSWCCLCALGLSGSGDRQGDLQPPPWRSSLPWGVRNKDPLLLVPILFSQDVALCRINWRKKKKPIIISLYMHNSLCTVIRPALHKTRTLRWRSRNKNKTLKLNLQNKGRSGH